MRITGIVAGWVAVLLTLVGMDLTTVELLPWFALALTAAGAFMSTINKRLSALALWALTLVLLLPRLALGGARPVTLGAAVMGIVALLALVIRNPAREAEQRAVRAASAEAQAHEERVAEIAKWEAAYRDAHDGAAPPAGFAPPTAIGGSNAKRETSRANLVLGYLFVGVLIVFAILKIVVRLG